MPLMGPFPKKVDEDELAQLAAQLEAEAVAQGAAGTNLPGAKVEFAPESAAQPVSAAARQPIIPKVVNVPGRADEDLEMAYATAADRQARSRMAFERGARELVGGLTRTAPTGITPMPTDAVAQLLAKRREADERQGKATQARLAGQRIDFDAQEAARKAAVEGQKDTRDFEYRQKHDADALAASRENSAANRDLAKASLGVQLRREGREIEAEGPKAASDLRKEFNQLQAVKTFGEVESAYEKVKAAAADPSAAGDLSAIFAYMKMLDPGSSVREGEFANAQNAGGIDEKIRAQFNNIKNGERLTPEQRADFINQAKKLYATHKAQLDAQRTRYGDLATKAGLDPNDVIGRLASPATTPSRPRAENDAGEVVEWDGGAWVRVK